MIKEMNDKLYLGQIKAAEYIKQLAEQAWNFTRDEIGSFVDDGGEVNWDFLHTYNKKFAESIIRECISVVDDMADPEDSDRYFWAIQEVSRKIKEHFGVEE